jgi:hypothetical protein
VLKVFEVEPILQEKDEKPDVVVCRTLWKVFSNACRGVLLRNPINEGFLAHSLEASGYMSAEVVQSVSYLMQATLEFFDTLPSRLDGRYAFIAPMLRMDLPGMMRFCRGLALGDYSYASTVSVFARLWCHEILREFLDRVPPHPGLREKVTRLLSQAISRVPMDDHKMAALQVSIMDDHEPLLWTHVPWLWGAHLKHPENALDQDPYEIKVAYREICAASAEMSESQNVGFLAKAT